MSLKTVTFVVGETEGGVGQQQDEHPMEREQKMGATYLGYSHRQTTKNQ